MGRKPRDLTFRSFNGLFVYGREWDNHCGRYLWKVRCSCGNLRENMSTENVLKYTGKRGCRCPSRAVFKGDCVVVDCSSPKFPETFTILDTDVYLEKFQGSKLIVRRVGEGGHIYVFNNDIPIHRTINNTPENFITDHISGDTLDNRASNLRTVNKSQNGQNSKKNKDNTSGFSGVSFRKDTGKWVAKITVDNKVVYLGTSFPDKITALIHRLTAEMKYGFHENHGRSS